MERERKRDVMREKEFVMFVIVYTTSVMELQENVCD